MAEAMTSLLERFGISYPNAPAPTPAHLAFMRGLGMTLDTAEDSKRVNQLRLKERANQSREEITRQNERSLTRMAGDLQSRGVLSSGETNTRVGRQAENVAKARSDVEQGLAEGIDATEQGYMNTRDVLRQQGLEKTLGLETELSREAAATAAQERSWQRQEDASEKAYQREKEARDAAFKAQEDQFKRLYGGLW
jgi:hypothetical protein